jgi:Uma2 family endonuclease
MTFVQGVMLDVSPEALARRKLTGVDRRDELWEGVWHMAPAPSREHQRILDELIVFLLPLSRRARRGTLHSGINVFDERSRSENYRIPDVTFVGAGRESILAEDGVRGGAPDAVIEIRSPGDESYDKLAFFASLGVREVIVIDRDTKKPEIYRLAGSQYVAVAVDREGWVASETLGVRWRQSPGSPVLALEDVDDAVARTEI